MSKIIEARIELDDLEAAHEILKILKAPVTQANVANLRLIIAEVGEMYEEAYNQMLVDCGNEKLGMFSAKCPCGRLIQVDVAKEDITGGFQC